MYRFGTSIPWLLRKTQWPEKEGPPAQRNVAPRGGETMVTWVLTEEPNAAVRRALELIEERVNSDSDVMWLCPSEVEPVQE
jgi:hypothetical protein